MYFSSTLGFVCVSDFEVKFSAQSFIRAVGSFLHFDCLSLCLCVGLPGSFRLN